MLAARMGMGARGQLVGTSGSAGLGRWRVRSRLHPLASTAWGAVRCFLLLGCGGLIDINYFFLKQ